MAPIHTTLVTRRGGRLPARRLCVFLLFAGLLLIPRTAWSIDDLFDEPDADLQEEPEDRAPDEDSEVDVETDAADSDDDFVDVGALTTSPTTFSGSVTTGIGAAVSLVDWPWTDTGQELEGAELYDYTGGYDLSATFSVDARPTGNLRFNARLATELNPGEMAFEPPEFDRLFVDYTLADAVSFRAGRYSMTWGQARVLENGANLVDEVGDGIALRAVVPVGRGTITGVGFSTGDWVGEYSPGDPRAFAFASQWETSFDTASFGISAKGRWEETFDTSAYFQTGIGAFDLTLEATNRWDIEAPFAPERPEFEFLTQLMWDGGDPTWGVIVEHIFDASELDVRSQRAGVGVVMPRFSAFGTRWRPQVRVRHAFIDNTGEVVSGFTSTVADDLEMTVGLPVRYGPPGGYYRDGDFGGDVQNIGGVAAVGAGLSLSFSF